MPTVRNPLHGFLITIVGAFGLSILLAVPALIIYWFVPYFEIQLLYLGFTMLGVGAVAGRSSLLGSMGFVGALVGTFFGILAFQYIFFPTGWEFILALILAALAGAGGLITGKLGLRRVEKLIKAQPPSRRCARCGARVGITARKCWSCRAYLPPT